ncbi:hypothetical protein [Rhizobium tumorigenes]|uniref:hypothetical protein n=1 Tax=Rhizobium tumorigenes TaxID=2041385 RepID=UPI00241D0E02|nr:hypothetical protein [Rhizobium tumorigenes]WFS02201.1 hypothetical protein PR016_06200 [Rhizobium tumorigenes]
MLTSMGVDTSSEDHGIFEDSDLVGELTSFTRRVGRTITPQVLAQQLYLTGHRATAEISRPMEIAMRAMSTMLLDLDEFAAEEKTRIAKALEVKPEVPMLPVEETALRPTAGPMETY